MRTVFFAMVVIVLAQAVAYGQSSQERKGWGYVFGGAGASSGDFSRSYFQFGGGGDVLAYKGLGLGAEIGYLAPFESKGEGAGLFSANTSYHFARSSKLVPFVTGGFSSVFRGGSSQGGNVGGGVHYWMNDHLGLRLEVRDHIFSSDAPHLFQFRVGLSFR